MSVLDTNVLLHAHLPSSPWHERAIIAVQRAGLAPPVCVTRQVLREFVSSASRPQPWSRPEPIAEAMDAAAVLSARFRVLEDGPDVWKQLRELSRSIPFGGKQVHDANIVATMIAHGETVLFTFNTSDFRRFRDHVELIEP